MTNLPILGVTCDDLTDPVNGEVQFTTRFGDTATYTCTLGYMPDGASERTCEANGEWSGVAPACVRKFTSDPYCHLLDIVFSLALHLYYLAMSISRTTHDTIAVGINF